MTRSARSELYRIVQDCQQRLDGGVGTEYDVVMTKVAEYIAAIEKKLCEVQMEKEFFYAKDLTKEEQIRVNNSILSKEVNDD